MIRTFAGALLAALFLSAPALAQDAFSGEWSLEGRMGRRSTAVDLKIERKNGAYSVTRTGRLTASNYHGQPAFSWDASSVRVQSSGRHLIVDYRIQVGGGAAGALTGTSSDTLFARGYYRRTSSGQLREYVYNYTKRGQWSFWRTAITHGDPVGGDLAILLDTLRKQADGLWYMSESDAPLTPRALQGAGDVDLAGFKKAAGFPAQRDAEVASFDRYYDNMTEVWSGMDPEQERDARRFKVLLDTFKANLSDLRVYRVADEHSSFSSFGEITGGIHVFLAGKDAAGNLVVLETFSVET